MDSTRTVEAAMQHLPPFTEIEIHASRRIINAVSLGIMLAFFISIGIVPNMELKTI